LSSPFQKNLGTRIEPISADKCFKQLVAACFLKRRIEKNNIEMGSGTPKELKSISLADCGFPHTKRSPLPFQISSHLGLPFHKMHRAGPT
jgi:hypothetical protein